MYKVVLCHRRKAGLSRRAYLARFCEARKQLVAQVQPTLEFSDYTQIVGVARFDPVRIATGLARSAILLRLASVFERTVPPANGMGQAASVRSWDLVETFSFERKSALIHAFSGSCLTDLAKLQNFQLNCDELAVPYTAQVVGRLGAPGQVLTLWFLSRRADLTHQQMLRRWAGPHRELFRGLQPSLAYQEYEQWHVESIPETAGGLPALSVGVSSSSPDCDGVAVIGFRSARDLAASFSRWTALRANFRLARDELHFVDHARSSMIYGHRRHGGPRIVPLHDPVLASCDGPTIRRAGGSKSPC